MVQETSKISFVMIKDSGLRKKNPSGREAIVWVVNV